MKLKLRVAFFSLFFCLVSYCFAQKTDIAKLTAATIMDNFNPKPGDDAKLTEWNYTQGVMWTALEQLWEATGDGTYFNFVKNAIDNYIDDNGNIKTYKSSDFKLDDVLNGRNLLTLYKVTQKVKYLKAAQILRTQLAQQPRNKEGGFWHKKIYPNQMWLDGLYMAEPFYGEYAKEFKEETDFADIAHQFLLVNKYMRDAKTGLLYHGWNDTRQEKWADKKTGLSENFWARAMGWYGMALVDVLDDFPANNPGKKSLIRVLSQFAEAIKKVQDPQTGLWWDVLNFPDRQGNYLEASASSMFVYTLAKAVRKGYIPAAYLPVAKKGYGGILHHFVHIGNDGKLMLSGTVSVSGLGGNASHYRDGSYEYYLREKVVDNDPKGLGAFLQATNEMNLLATYSLGKNKTVLLDSYFNNEKITDKAGNSHSFHYKWEEEDNNGYSIFGKAFNRFGFVTKTSYDPPTKPLLKGVAVYIIVDADITTENPTPRYMTKAYAQTIFDWVKKGGVLLIMNNDSGNADIRHLNILDQMLGFTFNEDSYNKVKGREFKMGGIPIESNNPVFKTASEVYIKELSTIRVEDNKVEKVLTKDGRTIAVTAAIGKGTVFAVGDPWFYNEYTNGLKLPPSFQNFTAMEDLIKWLTPKTDNK